MIQKTLFPFKLETTKGNLTARGALALMAEFNHGIGLVDSEDIGSVGYRRPNLSHTSF